LPLSELGGIRTLIFVPMLKQNEVVASATRRSRKTRGPCPLARSFQAAARKTTSLRHGRCSRETKKDDGLTPEEEALVGGDGGASGIDA